MSTIHTNVERAVTRLRAGALVAMPTETVYGLAADARNDEAVRRVFACKGRPNTNPLIVHVGEAAWVDDWAHAIDERARVLMAHFWPGPLTLVLPARDHVSRVVTAGQDTVALRQPAHPMALALLRAFGGALVAPSANRFMALSPTMADHVAHQFADDDLDILDGGPCTVGLESTIVSVFLGEPVHLLRPGMITRTELEVVLGEAVDVDRVGAVRVPGQHHRHYAPRTPCHRFDVDLSEELRSNVNVGWLFCGRPNEVRGPSRDLGSDPACYARDLYAALYDLDHAELAAIYVQVPPEEERWRAVRDRVFRATSP
ncbi:MAG: threonylcarbamoyl-AMP synthase [Planctomycetes bacterium]|nr:threonylcarbamoyl-AMP synthase [Planctomycetota bacterium]MCB9890850.1 threonylcarbamoyl-AMP synthase [Planctomycetota bacterium]